MGKNGLLVKMFLISEIFGVKIIIIMETKRNLLIFFLELIYHLFGHRLVGVLGESQRFISLSRMYAKHHLQRY